MFPEGAPTAGGDQDTILDKAADPMFGVARAWLRLGTSCLDAYDQALRPHLFRATGITASFEADGTASGRHCLGREAASERLPTSVEVVQPLRRAAVEGELLDLRASGGDALERVPQCRVASSHLVDRKIALETAPFGTE